MSRAAEKIYNEYKNAIYSYFYRSTLNSHISEDLTQDTFLKAFKYFSNFRGESSVKTWLFTIARNTYISHIRKHGDVREENIDQYQAADHRDAYSSSDERMLVRKILQRLSEEERTLIILRDINGLSYSEIARVMEYTEGKVKIGLHRARKRFKEYYNIENREV